MQLGCGSFIYCPHVSSDPCSQVFIVSFTLHLHPTFFQNHDQHLRGHHYQLSAEMSRQQQGVFEDLVSLHPLLDQPSNGGQCLSKPPHILVCWHNLQSSLLKLFQSVQDKQTLFQHWQNEKTCCSPTSWSFKTCSYSNIHPQFLINVTSIYKWTKT